MRWFNCATAAKVKSNSHLYLYIRRPPLEGPPGCEGTVRSPAIWYPASLSILLALELYILYILSLVSILLLSVWSVVLTPTDYPFYLPFPRGAGFWAPPPTSRNPFKSRKLTNIAKFRKSESRVPQKQFRNVSKSIPTLMKLTRILQNGKLTKTFIFSMVLAHLATWFQRAFRTEAYWKATWKPILNLVSLKSLKSEPAAPKHVPRRISKSLPNWWKSNPGSSCVSFADPGDPWTAKMMTRGAKSDSKGWKINSKHERDSMSDLKLHCLL